MLGAGLDARQFTDISGLRAEGLITPREKFFVRTAASAATVRAGGWTVALGGRVQRAVEMRVEALDAEVRAVGTHLMECSGNADPANFGLISTARWHGVPLLAVIERVQPLRGRGGCGSRGWMMRSRRHDHRFQAPAGSSRATIWPARAPFWRRG
jgi:DMSO/TMAO reductase YedYZ molybdopterin-dependent catalytic subunit